MCTATSVSRANVFLWHKRFLEGRKRLEDDNCEGRPISAMLITFFDSKGIIHREFISTGQTIAGAYYLKVLKCLRPDGLCCTIMHRVTPHSLFVNFWLKIKSVC